MRAIRLRVLTLRRVPFRNCARDFAPLLSLSVPSSLHENAHAATSLPQRRLSRPAALSSAVAGEVDRAQHPPGPPERSRA